LKQKKLEHKKQSLTNMDVTEGNKTHRF